MSRWLRTWAGATAWWFGLVGLLVLLVGLGLHLRGELDRTLGGLLDEMGRCC